MDLSTINETKPNFKLIEVINNLRQNIYRSGVAVVMLTNKQVKHVSIKENQLKQDMRKEDSESSLSSGKEARAKKAATSQAASAGSGSQAGSEAHGSQEDSARRESQSDSVRRGSRSILRGSQDIAVGGTGAHSVSLGASGEGTGHVDITQTTFSDTLILVQRNLKKTVISAFEFWKKVREDRFRWQLFKSVLFFTLGLKLFDDLKRHMAHVAKGPAKGAGVKALGRGAKAAANCKRSVS